MQKNIDNFGVRLTQAGPLLMSALGQKRTLAHLRLMSALPPKADIGTQSRNVRFVPIALCQKRTFRPLLDIIVGGQGCSSSWSITRETSPSPILVSHSRRRRAPCHGARRIGARLAEATGTHHCRLCRWPKPGHHGTADRAMAIGTSQPA